MEKHAGKVRKQREGVRKQHVKRAHQRQVTVCSMSILNRKRALKQSREREKNYFCSHVFTSKGLDIKCTHKSRGLRPSAGRSYFMESRDRK